MCFFQAGSIAQQPRVAFAWVAMALQCGEIEVVDLDSTCVDEGLMHKHMVVGEPPSSQIAAPAPSGGSDGSKVSLSRDSSLLAVTAPSFRAFKVSAKVEKFMTNTGSSAATWFALICSCQMVVTNTF